MIVTQKIQADRLTICKGCKWFNAKYLTCGTPLFGKKVEEDTAAINDNKVTYYKRKIKLCGCFMRVKTKYTWASCPADKWGMVNITPDELKKVKELLMKYEGRTSFESRELAPLVQALSKISGRNIPMCTSCGGSVRQLLDDLKKATQDIEID